MISSTVRILPLRKRGPGGFVRYGTGLRAGPKNQNTINHQGTKSPR